MDSTLEKNYLTVDEVRTITHLSNDTIRKHIRNGILKAYKVGNRYLVAKQDLEIFIESNGKKAI